MDYKEYYDYGAATPQNSLTAKKDWAKSHLSSFQENQGRSDYRCPDCECGSFCEHKKEFFYSGAHILLPGVGESAMSFGKSKNHEFR